MSVLQDTPEINLRCRDASSDVSVGSVGREADAGTLHPAAHSEGSLSPLPCPSSPPLSGKLWGRSDRDNRERDEGSWAWYQPRRKSCEQHSALGGVPALLRGEGVGGGRSVPPYPKEFYKDTDCSLVFDNPILHIPAGLLPFLCSSPPFTTCSGFCLLFSLL